MRRVVQRLLWLHGGNGLVCHACCGQFRGIIARPRGYDGVRMLTNRASTDMLLLLLLHLLLRPLKTVAWSFGCRTT